MGIDAVTARDPEFPAVLRHDPQPPAVLFVRGDLAALDARRVGIVGTRNATQTGRDIAFELGTALAEAGVAVVSGLAKGIDGAAHRGVLGVDGGRPVAVVGNGPDAPYPRVHAALWAEVCARGVLLSEWPPGTAPEPFRFPLRNRILAALSEVLVVVESRERGGSLITAQAAIERSVDVMAVPGSVRNRAAAGTNQLLRDGAGAGHGRRRRARRPRPRHPPRRPRGVRPATAPAWHGGRRPGGLPARTRARSTRSSSASTCRSPRRRWRSPASSGPAGCARPVAGSNRSGHGRSARDQAGERGVGGDLRARRASAPDDSVVRR